MGPNLWRYAGIYIAAALGIAVLIWLAESLFAFRLPTGLSTALPPMLAAMIEGQAHARATRAPLVSSTAWAAALRMTAVVAVLNAVVLVGAFLFMPELADPQVMVIAGGVFVLLLGVVLLVNRYFFGLGAKTQLQALDREWPEP